MMTNLRQTEQTTSSITLNKGDVYTLQEAIVFAIRAAENLAKDDSMPKDFRRLAQYQAHTYRGLHAKIQQSVRS